VNEPANSIGQVSVRVRYPETDKMGVAWHGHYLAWFELGRTEWMRDAGCPYGELEDDRGILFPVVRVGAEYKASARYDDQLYVRTRLARLGGVRVRFEYEVFRETTDQLLATGFTEHGAVDTQGKPQRLPVELRERLIEHGASC
jgi:acyl-CoA thioester hydrolase